MISDERPVDWEERYERLRRQLNEAAAAVYEWELNMGQRENWRIVNLAARIRVNAGLRNTDGLEVLT